MQGTFEIAGAQILSPGDPYRSVLYYRMAEAGPRADAAHRLGCSSMSAGLRLIHDWIPATARPQGRAGAARQAPRHGRPRAKERAADHPAIAGHHAGALMLADALEEGRLPAAVRAGGSGRGDGPHRFAGARPLRALRPRRPAAQTARQRHPAGTDSALKGNAGRGKELFFKSAGLQCINCHRVGGTGSKLGPDLSDIGKKYTRAQILESILEPSKFIDPEVRHLLVETTDGKVLTGLLAAKNERKWC